MPSYASDEDEMVELKRRLFRGLEHLNDSDKVFRNDPRLLEIYREVLKRRRVCPIDESTIITSNSDAFNGFMSHRR